MTRLRLQESVFCSKSQELGSFTQAAAAAQAGASVIQVYVGRVRDWARNHSGDKDVDAALQMGQDPGVALAMKTYNYIHRYGYKSKVMAAAIRNKQDVFSLLGLDYLIVPVKILQFLKESKADLGEKYAFEPRLTKSAARAIEFSDYETKRWDQARFAENLGPLGEQMLRASLLGNVEQTTRIEQYFAKIWPPPNV